MSELIDIKHGFAFKGEFFADEPTSDILVTPGNFAIGGGFQLNKPKFYNGPVPKEYVLNPGDVIVTMTDLSKQADTLGFSAVVPAIKPRLLHNQRIGRLIAKDASANLGFIAWLMRTRPYRHEIVGGATGSTVKHTSPGRILAHRFKLPSPKEQQSIVDVLQPLDDKIELNRQMNETLEGMAQAIFRDWFVDFGPTRRKTAGEADPVAIMGGLTPDPARAAELAALFPSAVGDDGLPVGWKRLKLADIAAQGKGSVNPLGQPNKTFEHYSLPAFDKGQEPSMDAGSSIKSNKTPVPAGAILLSKLNPEILRVWLPNAYSNAAQIASTEFLVFLPKAGASRSLLFALFRDPDFRALMQGMVTGTSKSHQRISPPALLAQEVISADPKLFVAFEALVGVMLERLLASRAESKSLAETRDYLLPRLMSGAVRVAQKVEAA
ncbi:restriction endonuclease subunit S [Altererythrobacter sp. B11]|uniref:restriction endonuclease subunit S n=1 Tax=Altererythrobacter sp. B11 TaxID=2060312 RepID=UPI001E4CD51B|nr:restriction endonuclease subunit S [Altererythrobacter sp. B11]